jgi:cAMP-dependent protein kinase regulator
MGCTTSKPAVASSRHNNVNAAAAGGNSIDPLSAINPAVALGNILANAQHLRGAIGEKSRRVVKDGAHHLKNVFAIPLDFADLGAYSPPVHSKTEQEKEFIEKAVKGSSFIFDGLSHLELFPLVQAFEKQQVQAGTTIIKEGDEGDYFYVIYSGTVEFSVNGKVVGSATVGAAFGELSLLYTCPRAATVVARDASTLFRVDQKAFRFILRTQTEESGKMKYRLLKGVKFVKGLSDAYLTKLAANMTPRHFKKDEVLVEKNDKDCYFWILETGEVKIQEIPFGGGRLVDLTIKAGGYFGHLTVSTGKRQFENVVALSDGRAFLIDEETFKSTLGDLAKLMIRSRDIDILVSNHHQFYSSLLKRSLNALQHSSSLYTLFSFAAFLYSQAFTKDIVDTKLEPRTIQALAGFIKEVSLPSGEYIMKENEQTEAAMYFIRSGKLQLTTNARDEIYEGVSTLGAKLLLADAITGKNGPTDSTSVSAPYTVQVIEDCRLGVLSLKDCRKAVDTIYIGKGIDLTHDSLVERKVRLEDLTKHRILGAGTLCLCFSYCPALQIVWSAESCPSQR